VTVTLSDGRTPPIRTFGPLWLCEWVSEWQEALVTVGTESHKAFHRVRATSGLAAPTTKVPTDALTCREPRCSPRENHLWDEADVDRGRP
jgi:hypothetical protein